MSATALASLPEPPYDAVIFSSQRTVGDAGYDEMSQRMAELAAAWRRRRCAEARRGLVCGNPARVPRGHDIPSGP
jgi:hypothetical protein